MVKVLLLPSISPVYNPRLKSWYWASSILFITMGIVVVVLVVVTGIEVVVGNVVVVVFEIISKSVISLISTIFSILLSIFTNWVIANKDSEIISNAPIDLKEINFILLVLSDTAWVTVKFVIVFLLLNGWRDDFF